MFMQGGKLEHTRFCEVRTLEEENNRYGIFATDDVEAGDEICCELPFIACPTALTPDAVNKHCELCLSGIEAPEGYVRRIYKNSEYYSNFLNRVTHAVPPENNEVVMCESGCGAVYCSANCRKNAWTDFHRQLCPGTDAKKVNKLEELRNLWRGIQVQVPFKMFDVGLLLRIIGSGSHTEFTRIAMLIDQERSALPVLAESETRGFVRRVFGPAYLVVVGLIEQYCGMQGMAVIDEVDGNRLMGPNIIMGVIHVLLRASVEVQGSSFKSFIDRFEQNTNFDHCDFQPEQDLSSLHKITTELESKVETSKEFNFAGFALFKSHLYARRSEEQQNAAVYYASNKSMLYTRAVKDIKKGEEILIGKVPQQIVEEWNASLELEDQELEETSSSSDETDIMEVDMEMNIQNYQEENRGRGRRRPFQALTHTPASSQHNSSATESGTEVEEPDEPPYRRQRLDTGRMRHNYTAAALKKFTGMSLALPDVMNRDFDKKEDSAIQSEDFMIHVSQRLGIDNNHAFKTLVGRVMNNVLKIKNFKKTVYSDNGRSEGPKHHYLGITPKPGVQIKCTYVDPGRHSLQE